MCNVCNVRSVVDADDVHVSVTIKTRMTRCWRTCPESKSVFKTPSKTWFAAFEHSRTVGGKGERSWRASLGMVDALKCL